MERLKNGALKFYEVVLEILEMGIALFLVVLIAMNLFELFVHIEFNASLTVAFKNLQTYLALHEPDYLHGIYPHGLYPHDAGCA